MNNNQTSISLANTTRKPIYPDNPNYFGTNYDEYDFSEPTFKPNVKVKRHVVLMNRAGRDFEREYREFEGEIIDIRFNGQDYNVFVPFIPFKLGDINRLRKQGWHVREMPIPEAYAF